MFYRVPGWPEKFGQILPLFPLSKTLWRQESAWVNRMMQGPSSDARKRGKLPEAGRLQKM